MIELPPNAVQPKDRADWRAWLNEHHAQTGGVWFVSYKKSTGKPGVEYEKAVEEALCFGWIDSKAKKLDDECIMLWFVSRRPGSGWSRSNKERIEKLIAAGLMAAPGLAKIEAARQDGSWTALDVAEAGETPPDLEQALAANDLARQHYTAFPKSVKRAILVWITSAKRPETRARRIQETVRLAQDNLRANQPGQ